MYIFHSREKQIIDYRYKWSRCFYEWMNDMGVPKSVHEDIPTDRKRRSTKGKMKKPIPVKTEEE